MFTCRKKKCPWKLTSHRANHFFCYFDLHFLTEHYRSLACKCNLYCWVPLLFTSQAIHVQILCVLAGPARASESYDIENSGGLRLKCKGIINIHKFSLPPWKKMVSQHTANCCKVLCKRTSPFFVNGSISWERDRKKLLWQCIVSPSYPLAPNCLEETKARQFQLWLAVCVLGGRCFSSASDSLIFWLCSSTMLQLV